MIVEHDSRTEIPAHVAETLGQSVGDLTMEKIMLSRRRRGTRTVPPHHRLIENLHCVNHGATMARRATNRKGSRAAVVLMDDVMTTCATVNACARALKRSSAETVDVVNLARVVPEAE